MTCAQPETHDLSPCSIAPKNPPTMTSHVLRDRCRRRGFTLVEILIVLAIVSIVVAMILPIYKSYAKKNRVRVSEQNLMALAMTLENKLSLNSSYPTLDTETNSSTQEAFPSWRPSGLKNFTYTITSMDDDYTVTATGTSKILKGCMLSLDRAGRRQISGCGEITSWL